MALLSLKLLGSFQAYQEGKELTVFRTNKVQALLIFLTVEPSAHRREALMELLWPGMPERSARQNLRQILHHLRNAISDSPASTEESEGALPLILANRQTIQRNPAADVEVDALHFETFIDGTLSHEHPDLLICHACRSNLEKAVALYRGDFLADFYLDDSNEFEDWAQINREAYRRKALDAMEILATVHTRQQEYAQAREYAERQLNIDNLREGAYRQLMEILALAGHREEALAVYEKSRRVLAEELAMAPAKRTTEMYEQILAGDLSFESSLAQGVRGYELKDEIGKGAYGAIHRAIQPGVDREVAVKVILRKYANDPEFIRRFETEAQIIAHLEHHHVVPLYDYWRDPDGAYLVMRYLRGGSLLSALESGPWELEPAARMLDQVTAALAAAHRQGVVHRDIKPANILLDEAGNGFLSDFGIAKDLTGEMPMTAKGAIVGSPDYISPEQILNETVTPQTDIYSLGTVLYETLAGEKPFPDSSVANLIYKHLNEPIPPLSASRPELPPQIDEVIQRATAKQPADRYADALEMAEAFRRAIKGETIGIAIDGTLAMPADVPAEEVYNPYKGLRAFQEADADDFFGREALIDQLITRLTTSRFLAVVGPSGSGKSSVVKAGLIPALREGAIPPQGNQASSHKWFLAEMVPGTHPFEELELALWPIAVDPPPSLVEPMQRDTRGLLRTIRRILPDEPGAQLLLIIDQFEELFTLVEDKERREFFIDSLLQAVTTPRTPLQVIITLRADFYDRPLQYESLGRLIKANTEIALPLSAEELTWAVREPARRMGVSLEPGLVEAIVADVTNQPGGLPLLQYLLTTLFDKHQNRTMTRATYEEIGGVQAALGRRANEIYDGLDETGREATRQLFLRLVTLGEGVEDTRRRVLRSELEALEDSDRWAIASDQTYIPIHNSPFTIHHSQLSSVIDAFGTARLLTFDHDPITRGPTVEVAHEALLREWDRLRSWLDESRNDIRVQQMLDLAAKEWAESGRDESYLLRGSRLDHFAGWATDSTVALTEDERTFLEASISDHEAHQAEEEARRQRELETARKLAETEQAKAKAERQRAEEQAQAAERLRRRAYVLAGVLALVVLLAIVTFLFARQSSRNAIVAQENADLAFEQRSLAATREAEALAEAKQRATAQAQTEVERQRAEEQREVALTAEAQAELEAEQRAIAQAEAESEADIAFSRELSAAALSNLTVDPERSILLALQAMAITHTVAAENTLHQAVLSSRLRRTLEIPGDNRAYLLARSPDGSRLFSSGENGGELWDVESGDVLVSRFINGYINQAAFSPDGTLLFLPNEEFDKPDQGTVTILEAESGQELFTFIAHDTYVTSVVFHPDGDRFATAGGDGTVRIWDFPATLADKTGNLLLTLPGNGSPVWEVAFNQNGTLVATANENGTATVWDAGSGQELVTVNIGPGGLVLILNVFFSRDGEYLITSGGEGTVDIWDVNTGQRVSRTIAHASFIQDLKLSPDGTMLATAAADATAKLWRFSADGLEELMTLTGHASRLRSIEFSPDGLQLITSSRDNTIRFWDISPHGSEELPTLIGHDSWITGLAINTDGSRLVSSSHDGTAIVWDVETGQRLFTLSDQIGRVNSVDFSPDGKMLATATEDTTVNLWDAVTGRRLATLVGHAEGNIGNVFDGVVDIEFSPDGARVATAGADGMAKVWDVETGAELISFMGHPEGYGLTVVTFSPDGTLLAVGTDHGQEASSIVKVWESSSGQEQYTLVGQERIWSIAFSPDGNRLGMADRSGVVSMWALPRREGDTEIGDSEVKQLFSVPVHSSRAGGLHFTPDGKQIVTAGEDGKLSFRESWTGEPLLTIDRPIGLGETVISPDGKWLAAAGKDGRVYIYVLDPDMLLSLAQSRVTRSLTTAECQQYLHMPECPES